MILIFEQDLTHYRVLFYEYLSKRVDEKLLIAFGKGEPGAFHILEGNNSNRNFNIIQFGRRWIGKSIYINSFSDIKNLFFSNEISCVIHRGAIRNINLYREILFFQKNNVPVILRGIGFSNKREFNPKRNPIDRYHRFIIDACDAYLCYTDGSKKILDNYYNPNKIFTAVNTLNSELMNEHYNQLNSLGKSRVKSDLNLKCDKYIIHVGRMSARKRIKDLIDIYKIVKLNLNNIGLILVGDGVERVALQEYVRHNNIRDVIFTGSISSEDILVSKYIFASDVFLITGNIGLSINHAFFFGIPVVGYIAPNRHKAPIGYIQTPEYEYLIDGFNGYVVKEYDLQKFSMSVEKALNNPSLAINAYNFSQSKLTVDVMANGYLQSIAYVKNKYIGFNK